MSPLSPYSSRWEVIKLSIILVALTWAIIYWNWAWRWDQLIYDTQFSILEYETGDDIVVIAIDELSLKTLGRWPWSRRIHAQLVDILTDYAPKTIVLDIIFAEPNSNDPLGDQLLINAIKQNGQVVLPVLLEQQRLQGQLLETLPLPGLTQVSAALGHVHVELDVDGIARRTFLYEGLGEPRWPHIALATLQLLEPVMGPKRSERPTSFFGADAETQWQWVRDHHFLIPYVGPPGSFKTISYSTVLNGEADPLSFKDKIVLVGVTATGLGDTLPTPVSGQTHPMPGVEINANIIQALLTDTKIIEAGPVWQYLLAAIYVVTPILLFPYLSPRASLLLVLFAMLLLALSTLLSLHMANTWIPVSAPIVGLVLAYPLWTWRRLEFTIKFLNNELKRLALERKSFHEEDPLKADDAVTFMQSIMPLQGMALYDLNLTQQLSLGKMLHDTPSHKPGNEWRQDINGYFWRHLTADCDNYLIAVNWDDQQQPSETETELLSAYLLRNLDSNTTEPKSTVELIESRIREIEIATDNLTQIRRIISNSLEQMADGVLVTNRFGQIILANNQAGKFLSGDITKSISHQAVLPLLDKLNITTNDDWLTIIRDALFDCQPHQLQAQSSFHLDLLVSITPLLTSQKMVSGLIINFSDISELKNAERKRNEVLEFLSHDLRSPLVSIIALAEHAKSGKNKSHQNVMHNVENYANRAIQLAEDFVHLSRVESNDSVEFSLVELENIASNAIDAVWDQAKAKQITITQNTEGDTWVRGNGSILERAVINILNNAIKYSAAQTSVTLSVRGNTSAVQCCVEDQGMGIPKELNESIFDRFSRVDRGNFKPQSGIGLGLAFVKAAAEKHHGEVSVKSVPNKGSCFCITLPSEHSIALDKITGY